MRDSVLLDSNFFVHLLNDDDILHAETVAYYKYFLEQKIPMKVSTISIAEYCVRGKITDLPLRNLQIVPFNINHSERAGEFAKVLFDARKDGRLTVEQRPIIPNDSKLFAQCDKEISVAYFVTSDTKSEKLYNRLATELNDLTFRRVDIRTPYQTIFQVLL